MDSAPPDASVSDAAADAPSQDASDDAGNVPPTGRLAWEDCEGGGRELEAGPDDYRDVLSTLAPGDTLKLRPGNYLRGLPMRTSGEEGRCIVVEAQDPANRPRFMGSSDFNVLAIHGASWLKIRNLDVDIDGRAGFGVASQGGASQPTHHVVIEGLKISGFGSEQQVVGISTKSPATDWVIRGNHIEGPGTGLYLGNSNGREPFVRGLIERNVVLDAKGYCMQIKHQIERLEEQPEMAETVIRHNVFTKASGSSTGDLARPNLLLGHFPTSGRGQDDRYVVYRNFIYENATENLLQAEGNLLIFNNVLVNRSGGAISIRPHNDVPREVELAFNTIVASARGVSITGGHASFRQRAYLNAVFAGQPVRADDAQLNLEGSLADAETHLAAPGLAPGAGLDLHPSSLGAFSFPAAMPLARPEAAWDFDGVPRAVPVAGAYASTSGPALTLTP
ncbi:MAG: right-handed parallel beta-helix repeat-containing protein [Polyangiaceae bacterium]|nr:right-handed parallel beta-helix repeat-containing protein [Polyangiaceae bacterium]MCW5790013.1 right-handed parallel beta-helix repeat-containing protein [Polyangiaceae bacterium]